MILPFAGGAVPNAGELIDYICGIGIDPSVLLSIPSARSSPGWPGRFCEALIDYLTWIGSLSEEDAMAQSHRA